ncbi:type II toxin-antitoxin system HicB family antitoxin [Jonesia quinghaiensis]|uniref:type II toxin-antitoxin system HicB family antitoxin n=1 Tax=Jonesia quinghaiensis TaxID=262806 RepID=UPI0004147773|nr:type II toxin-antitoxin system HicB family antitoxin [Jonesia quinghaiensis]
MTNVEHYTYRVRWSAEDEACVATVAEFPSLSWIAETSVEATQGIRDLVIGVLEDMEQTGETPPQPFGERSYSGNFMVRVPPELHRQLAIEAAEQNVSLNRLATTRLVGTRN